MALIDNLIAYYKLDETSGTVVYDSLVTFNGTNNGATVNQSGKINTSYSFDGTNDYVSSDSNIGITGSNSRTINIWFNKNNYSADDDYLINLGYNGGGSTNTFFGFSIRSDVIYALLYANDFSTGVTPSHSTWYMVTLTYDGTIVRAYVNGSASGTYTGALSTNNAPVYLGGLNAAGFFNGKLDEAGVWSRALTSDEVTELYNSGNGWSYSLDNTFVASVLTLSTTSQSPLYLITISKNNLSLSLSLKSPTIIKVKDVVYNYNYKAISKNFPVPYKIRMKL